MAAFFSGTGVPPVRTNVGSASVPQARFIVFRIRSAPVLGRSNVTYRAARYS